jgi:hypothetical protein
MILINNRDRIPWSEGITVTQVFAVMGYDYALITVFINDVLVAEEEYDSTTIPDNANVQMIHLAHGG